jgi:MFS family permease
MPPLPREVRTLGVVSLLTDASSEMIFPLLPAFLTGPLRAGPRFVGLVEGLAEATATAFKIASGRLADRLRRRTPLIVGGYALSSAARPLIAAAALPWHVLGLRFLDRVGKGTRGAPRDALMADVTPAAERGRAFGFQRAMDHAGAMLGPLIASALLALGTPLRTVFALAAVPAVASVLVLVFGLRERDGPPPAVDPPPPPTAVDPAADPTDPHPAAERGLGAYLGVLAVFTLGNSSDAFLLLRAQDVGVALPLLPLLWAFHHLVKSAASTHGGRLSDRIGRRRAILAGWTLYAAAYAGFALARAAWQVWPLFALYGAFHALTEGPERALVADLARAGARGRAFGLFHAVAGGMMLPASLLTGALWHAYGPAVALMIGALLAGAAAIGLWWLVPEPGSARPDGRG